MTTQTTVYKDAFILRVPFDGDETRNVFIFAGVGERKLPHARIMQFIENHGEDILAAFGPDSPIQYGDLPALIGRFARYQPVIEVVGSGDKEGNSVVITGIVRTVINNDKLAIYR